ncbi:MAG: CaiB/BaiF CoA transferase family protein [Aggregatilineaceae bacterium]
MAETGGLLEGVRVLDFSRILAGPFCTMLLGDLGADVIKVEQPGTGDGTRQWGPPWHGAGEAALSAYYASINRNKRSVTLNLKTEAGRALARDLAARCQVVVENFKAGHMAELGLDYEALRTRNPALVYCSITGFGQTGPYRDRPGYDYVIQAMSGLMSITGEPDGSPTKVGVAISDVIAGLFAASAILAALRHAERTGQGQYLDVALLDTQIAALVNVVSNYLVSGQTPPRLGNQHPNIVPYQTFRAADRAFVLACGTDAQFARLCAIIGRPDLLADERFATNPARVEHRTQLIPILEAVFVQRPASEWVEALLAADIPAGPIYDIPAALNDPQVEARGLVVEAPGRPGDPLKLIGPPVQCWPNPATVRRPPPALGAHTAEVLREVLGLDDAALTRYRQQGVI